MNKNILLKHLPGTAKYLASVFDAGLVERGSHHNYVVDQIVLNNKASLDEMTKEEKT